MSERGHFPPELEGLGLADIRETHFKPYRIVYQKSFSRTQRPFRG